MAALDRLTRSLIWNTLGLRKQQGETGGIMRWLITLAVAAILFGVTSLFRLAGWEIALGFLIGYVTCYVLYGCWRVDDYREGYSRFPPDERKERYERDRRIDPRL